MTKVNIDRRYKEWAQLGEEESRQGVHVELIEERQGPGEAVGYREETERGPVAAVGKKEPKINLDGRNLPNKVSEKAKEIMKKAIEDSHGPRVSSGNSHESSVNPNDLGVFDNKVNVLGNWDTNMKRGGMPAPEFTGAVPVPGPVGHWNNPVSTNPKAETAGDKAPFNLIPMTALAEMALVMCLGAEKYGPYNYRNVVIDTDVYVGAINRHFALWQDGEDDDPEGGKHLAAIMSCCALLLDAQVTGKIKDNRSLTGGKVREIMERTAKIFRESKEDG